MNARSHPKQHQIYSVIMNQPAPSRPANKPVVKNAAPTLSPVVTTVEVVELLDEEELLVVP